LVPWSVFYFIAIFPHAERRALLKLTDLAGLYEAPF